MAIGISGTNSNSSSVEVSVGPMPWVHRKDKTGILNEAKLYGCFDPGNKKTNAYGGTSGIDFVSGIPYTITGSANDYAQFKSENLGIIELTGDGYIQSDGVYPSTSSQDLANIELWFRPATGPTQEQTIFQFRGNGEYKNGYAMVLRGGVSNNRSIRFFGYRNDGTLTSIGFNISNGVFLDTWNHLTLNTFMQFGADSDFASISIKITSRFHEYTNQSVSLVGIGFPGTGTTQYNTGVSKQLTIGKAEGVTGTFRGKIGCTKIHFGSYPLTTLYDPEINPEDAGSVEGPKIMYRSLAPRYDQYL